LTTRHGGRDRIAPPVSFEFEMTAVSLEGLPRETDPEVALAGRSNVGKSSLINRVAGRTIARTSRTPGKTQAINFYRAAGLRLVDLPGYGFARAPMSVREEWSRLVDSYMETRGALAAILVLVDIRHPAFPDDREMVDWARRRGIPLLVVATKADKITRGELAAKIRGLRAGLSLSDEDAAPIVAGPGKPPAGERAPDEIVAFSSVSGAGRREVLTFLERFRR
jgi:GTP-binding protein